MNEHVELIPTRAKLPHPLGRAGVNHDARAALHRALVNPPPRVAQPFNIWYTRDVYDQGREPRCTCEAAVGLLRTSPLRPSFREWSQYDEPAERQALYKVAQTVDPWAGEGYDGTSTDAPFRVLRDRGVIGSWRWLFGEAELREYLSWYGPAVVGTLWYDDMFDPDPQTGFVKIGGRVAGGHAYRIVQFSNARRAYRIVNSWGRGWGQAGRAWISAADLGALLQQDGDAVTIG